LFSLKKKGKVIVHDVRKLDMKRIVRDVVDCDLFLFHAQIGNYDAATQYLILERFRLILQGCGGKKVLWFFEKIWGSKINIITELHDFVDVIFVNDETWLKRFKTDKIFPLHAAAPEKRIRGKFNKELACDIALIGNLYQGREKEFEFIKNKFGERVKIFNQVFDRDYADLCKSAKVVLAFRHPFDDFYWSDRIYKVLSYGGLLIHPRAQGLKDEGFISETHYLDYQEEQELYVSLRIMLDKKNEKLRKEIARNGKEFVRDITYAKRLDEIIKFKKPKTK
jgi:hypothetical protein